MVMRELDICLISATLPHITQLGMVDFWVSMLLHILLKNIVHGNESGDISGDYGRRGFRSQETSHSSTRNLG